MDPVFVLLGQVTVVVGGRPVRLFPQQRTVLAMLLLEAGRVLPVQRLAEALWAGEPPRSAPAVVQVTVSRLRRAVARVPDAALVACGGGYRLDVDRERVDLYRFRDLVERARRSHDEEAAGLLRTALGLWRGPALGAVAGEWLPDRMAPALEEERLAAMDERISADLRLGRHDQLVAELTDLAARHPLRERATGYLMLALHRCGRTADALAAYRRAVAVAAEELGVDVGPALRDLHEAILRGDPELAAPRTHAAAAHPVPRPAQLPAGVPDLVGRVPELSRLVNPASRATVVAMDGMAGVGKTALAVHAAHLLTDRFPDGQLFVDLHGFAHDAAPVHPEDALDQLLRALGVAGDQIPPGRDARAALLRSRLAGRRILMVLDNAADEAQVRPLLPGYPGCLVLITSRRRLTGLDGADPLSLDVLRPPDAVSLFVGASGASGASGVAGAAGLTGAAGLAGHRAAAVAEVVELCGRLPLAVRIAAERLRHRPAWTLEHLVSLLRDERHRLAELRGVEAAFGSSYRHLTGDQRRLFRLLGLHPGPDIDVPAAAALAAAPAGEVRGLLEDLVDVHLLDQQEPGWYRLHDLVRAYAAAVATDRDREEYRAAQARLLALGDRNGARRHRRRTLGVVTDPGGDRTGADRTGVGRTGVGRTGVDRTGVDRTGGVRARLAELRADSHGRVAGEGA